MADLTEAGLHVLGYERIEYNGGTIIAYRLEFAHNRDWPFYIEVRFNEYKDGRMPIAYMVLPSVIMPLPGLTSIEEIEALRALLKKGSTD